MAGGQQKLLVLGTTPYAQVFVDSFEAIEGFLFAGYIENLDRGRAGQMLGELPIHWHDDIDGLSTDHLLTCSLATTARADWIGQMESRGFGFATLVHPSSQVSRRTALGPGVSVDAGTVLAGFSRIGSHVRIGRRVALGHHLEIGTFSTIHPGAIVSGNCRIGARVMVGTGAVIIDGVTVGDGAVIAAGAVVTKDVSQRTLVAGNPAVVKRADAGPR